MSMDTVVVSLSPLPLPLPLPLLRRRRHPDPATTASSACKLGLKQVNANPRRLPLPSPRRSPTFSASSSAAASANGTTTTKQKEKDVVFVAGATGRVGSRAVRELTKLGFRVRAAVRNPQSQSASSLLDLNQQQLNKVEIVECDMEKEGEEGIISAIGSASVVVCSIGASEKEIFDVTGPYRIDYLATKKLIQAAAAAANVEHFVLVTSLGTNRIGFPAFLLNLFWGVLCWKRRAEEALIASGIPYTIIRPGGMERPTDAFKETHNLVLAAEDTYVGGLVSNLQVAELIGCIADNRKEAAYCKVVEAVAETTAPLLPMEQLLAAIPSSSSRSPPPSAAVAAVGEELLDDDVPAVTPATPTATAPDAAMTTAAERPLSPYTAYEGLKPPSSPSPSPTPSKSKSTSSAVKDDARSNNNNQNKLVQQQLSDADASSSRPLSPYTAYDELKPPSSPTPSAPKT